MQHLTGPAPVLIQGGMGVAISSWQLASTVARSGQLGVVSGTALDSVVARRLQDGDPGGDLRRALAHFPLPGIADRILARYFRPDGRGDEPYMPIHRVALRASKARDELTVAANFAEVWLAKEGHTGRVGINYLEKIQMALPAAAYGAVLAGVDVVLVGAGIPRQLPRMLTELAAHRPATIQVEVLGGDPQPLTFDPSTLVAPSDQPPVRRPAFVAIVSSHVLAQYLARNTETCPDGFVVEGPSAGGHSAPPRGKLELDTDGQPVYGPRDEVKLAALRSIGLPFWLAGGYGTPERVVEALACGATGVQVGTLFALCRESGFAAELRTGLLNRLGNDDLTVRADAVASPTGFPFKVVSLPGTLSDPETVTARPKLCDLGYLRQPYERAGGAIGYRCAAEPTDVYIRKGGTPGGDAVCLCNALLASTGLGQQRKDGYQELPLVTLGTDLDGAKRLVDLGMPGGPERNTPTPVPGWNATDVVGWLLAGVAGAQTEPDAVLAEPTAAVSGEGAPVADAVPVTDAVPVAVAG